MNEQEFKKLISLILEFEKSAAQTANLQGGSLLDFIGWLQLKK